MVFSIVYHSSWDSPADAFRREFNWGRITQEELNDLLNSLEKNPWPVVNVINWIKERILWISAKK